MRVLIVSANTFSCSPSGPAYVAGAAREAGHMVEVFDSLFAQDLIREADYEWAIASALPINLQG